jgi:hypothetical protein
LTPVSILTRPDLVQADTNGIHALTLAIQDKQIVELKSTGTVQRIPPTSTESQVCVWAYAQAYGKLP